MANIANVVSVGPFTTSTGGTETLICSAERVRAPLPQPLNVTSAGGHTESSGTF